MPLLRGPRPLRPLLKIGRRRCSDGAGPTHSQRTELSKRKVRARRFNATGSSSLFATESSGNGA